MHLSGQSSRGISARGTERPRTPSRPVMVTVPSVGRDYSQPTNAASTHAVFSGSSVQVERLNSPFGSGRRPHNQTSLSDVLKLSDRLAGTPDLIKKTGVAAVEFRRLQEVEQESKNMERRFSAQLDMQQQQLAESRRQLLDQTGAFNRQLATNEARITTLEKEVADLHEALGNANERHGQERREWAAERAREENKLSVLQSRCDRSQDLLLDTDRRLHDLREQLEQAHVQVADKSADMRALEHRLRTSEDAERQAREHLVHGLRRAEKELADSEALGQHKLKEGMAREEAQASELAALRSDLSAAKKLAADQDAALGNQDAALVALREQAQSAEQQVNLLRSQVTCVCVCACKFVRVFVCVYNPPPTPPSRCLASVRLWST
jgi:hypothetical protein